MTLQASRSTVEAVEYPELLVAVPSPFPTDRAAVTGDRTITTVGRALVVSSKSYSTMLYLSQLSKNNFF